MLSLIDKILDIVLVSSREKRIYNELQNDPEKSAASTRFGKKAITAALASVVVGAFAVLFAFFAAGLQNAIKDQTLAIGFQFIGEIICIGSAAILALYSLLYPLSRLRYVRWQKKLNNHPIGTRAMIVMIICIIIDLALAIVAAFLILNALA